MENRTMRVTMKPNDSKHGWLTRLTEMGCKATYNHGPFGRTHWLIKKDAEAVEISQGKNSSLTTKIGNPTPKQREIAQCLVVSGIVTVTEVLTEAHADE